MDEHYSMPNIQITVEEHDEYKKYAAMQNGREAGSIKIAPHALHEPMLRERFPLTPVMYQLFVDEACRGQHIASALLNRAEEETALAGHNELLLGVLHDNAAARELYEKRGYEYITVDGSPTIDSVWEVIDDTGLARTEIVQVIPMRKRFSKELE